MSRPTDTDIAERRRVIEICMPVLQEVAKERKVKVDLESTNDYLGVLLDGDSSFKVWIQLAGSAFRFELRSSGRNQTTIRGLTDEEIERIVRQEFEQFLDNLGLRSV